MVCHLLNQQNRQFRFENIVTFLAFVTVASCTAVTSREVVVLESDGNYLKANILFYRDLFY